MLGMTSIWHWMIVLVVILILFGAGKLPKVMGDLAKGIKNFRSGMKEDEKEEAAAEGEPARRLAEGTTAQPAKEETVRS